MDSGKLLHIEQNSIDIDNMDISPFKLGSDFIEGDRMIPLRASEI